MTKTQIILSACLTIAMVMLPAASAGVSVAESVSGASVEDTFSNDAENAQGANNIAMTSRGYGDNTNSFANCQLALFFNTIVVNLAAADSLALVEEDSLLNGRVITPNLIEIDVEPTWDNSTSVSSCTQDIGPIVASIEGSDGFGEAAPQGGSIASLGEALWSSQQLNGGGVAVGVSVAGSSLNDVFENEFTSFQGSGVNSASSCQILVTWNTLLVNAGVAVADAEVDTNLSSEPPEIVLPLKTQGEYEGGYEGSENNADTSTSSCTQTIASLTLVIGDTPELPPQS